MESIREGIVNAVAHRDYTISGIDIRVDIFTGRLEIPIMSLDEVRNIENIPGRASKSTRSVPPAASNLLTKPKI
jgi:predicted HTH transcriptional regulator